MQRVVVGKQTLRTLLVLVGLAQDLVWVDVEFLVTGPVTITNVVIDELPVPSVVARILGLGSTALGATVAVDVADPNDVIGTGLEPNDWRAKRVRTRRCILRMPKLAAICCVVVFGRFGDKISPFVRVCVHVQAQEAFLRELLFPGEPLVP